MGDEPEVCGLVPLKFYNVIVHGFGFMCLFTAFQTSSMFQATVLDDVLHDSNLGFESLCIIYVVFAFANFVSPAIVDKMGVRFSMFVGACFYTLFIAAFLMPKVWTILGSSALLGINAAVLWTAQGSFITQNSTNENRGRNSGIFWAMLQSSVIIGNLIALIKLPDSQSISTDTAHMFYLILFCVAAAGCAILLFTRNAVEAEVQMSPLSTSLRSEKVASLTTWQMIKSTFALLRTKQMLQLGFIIFYTGLEQSMWGSKYQTMVGGKLNPGPSLPSAFNARFTAISGLVIGAAEIIGGSTMGRVADKLGRSFVVVIGLFVHTTAYFLIDLNFLSTVMEPSTGLALVISFLLGLGDCCFNTGLYALIGAVYKEQSLQAFALFKFFQAAASGVAFGYTGYIILEYQLLILCVFMLPGTYFFVRVDRTTSAYEDRGYQKIPNN